jgi:large subunit ribosomal protein L9
MKVVLLQDVPNVGSAGSIQSVSDGYARNCLIPRGLAEMATPGRIKDAEQRIRAEERRTERAEREQQSIADQIDGLRLPIEARVGGQGHLYGSITAQDVAEALSNKLGIEIDRRKMLLEEPIRTVGEHQVTLHLVGKLRPTLTVVVTSPEGVPGAFGNVEATPAEEDVASSAQAGPGAEVTDEAAGVSREQLES